MTYQEQFFIGSVSVIQISKIILVKILIQLISDMNYHQTSFLKNLGEIFDFSQTSGISNELS